MIVERRLPRNSNTTSAASPAPTTSTGLGVVLAQGVITQHGGTLSYASRVGHGTTATIVLPGKASPAPEPATRAAMIEASA